MVGGEELKDREAERGRMAWKEGYDMQNNSNNSCAFAFVKCFHIGSYFILIANLWGRSCASLVALQGKGQCFGGGGMVRGGNTHNTEEHG